VSLVLTGKESGLIQWPFLVTQNPIFISMKQKDSLVGFSMRLLGTKPDTVSWMGLWCKTQQVDSQLVRQKVLG
jgi:hypothetical protein